MTSFESLACLCLFILSVYIVWTPFSKYIRGTANVAPHVRGLPLVGGTLNLALQGADFIHTCRKRVRMKQWVASSVSDIPVVQVQSNAVCSTETSSECPWEANA